MKGLLIDETVPAAGVVGDVTAASRIVDIAIILLCRTKMSSVETLGKHAGLFAFSTRRSRSHSIFNRAIGDGYLFTVLLPRRRAFEALGKIFAVMFALQPNVGP
jgi:hypothetical protein